MAKTKEEREGDARMAVRFSMDDVLASIPREGREPNTALRRRSTITPTNNIPNPDERVQSIRTVHAVDEQGNDVAQDEVVEEETTLDELFSSMDEAALKQFQYSFDDEGLKLDFQQKIDDQAVKFANNNGGPSFHFRPISEDGRTAWPKANGTLDHAAFRNRFAENSEALFTEFKFRTFGFNASVLQTTELHNIATNLSRNLEYMYNWAAKGYLEIKDLNAELQALKRALPRVPKNTADDTGVTDALRAELVNRDQELDVWEKKYDESRAEITQLNQTITDLTVRMNSQRDHTVGADSLHTHITTGGTKVKRSAKIEDPPQWHDEPDKDKLTFKAWFRQIKNKLRNNADWYPTEDNKCTYIEGRLAGNASRDFLPYVDEKNPHRLQTMEAMTDHLWQRYFNPNRENEAITEFNDLKMIQPSSYESDRVDYAHFQNAFVRLSAELQKPAATWKAEFHRRLTPSLQKSLARELFDTAVTFEGIVRLGRIIDYTNQQADATTRARKNNDNKSTGGQSTRGRGNGGVGSNNSRPAAANNTATLTAKLPREEFDRLIREGRCLTCKEKGHRSRECPKRPAADPKIINEVEAAREARLQALYTRYGGGTEGPQSNKDKLNDPNDSEN